MRTVDLMSVSHVLAEKTAAGSVAGGAVVMAMGAVFVVAAVGFYLNSFGISARFYSAIMDAWAGDYRPFAIFGQKRFSFDDFRRLSLILYGVFGCFALAAGFYILIRLCRRRQRSTAQPQPDSHKAWTLGAAEMLRDKIMIEDRKRSSCDNSHCKSDCAIGMRPASCAGPERLMIWPVDGLPAGGRYPAVFRSTVSACEGGRRSKTDGHR